jgi:urease accessory protein
MSMNSSEKTLLVARPRSRAELARLAFEIGNLHVPAQITDDEISILPDGPVQEILDRLGIPWTIEVRPFHPRAVTP